MTFHQHPYYPTDLSLPNYQPLVIPFEQILACFFGGFVLVFGGIWFLTGKYKYLATTERLLACWFLCTGVIHLVIEGSVVLNSKFYEDTSGNILNEIWKEYAKADSRYATRDAFTIQMEAVTAFIEGPACFLIVFAILYRKAFRYVAIMLVSTGQLYGDVLYYATCFHVGVAKHSRPEPMYFWFYYIGVNFIWIVVPSLCIIYAAKHLNKAVKKAGGTDTKKVKAN
ncbi:MAG: hypothetical protein WDW38_005070 [Sanguina aurantia]